MAAQENVSSPCRVLLTDDHAIVRHAIKTIVESNGEFIVIGEAEDCDGTLQRLEALQPELLILDIALPGKSGIEILYEIRQRNLPVKVVVLTMYDDEEKALQAMRAGADAYLLKRSSPQEFIEALRQVRDGDQYLPSGFHHLQHDIEAHPAPSRDGAEADPLSRLSRREREIFYLLADGMPNRVIAKKLFISPRTVETHRARVLKKFNFSSTAELIRYAIRHNLLTI